MNESQQLDHLLRRAAQRKRRYAVGGAIAIAATSVLLAMIIAIAIDAFWGLATEIRIAVNVLLGTLTIAGVAYVMRVLIKNAYNPRGMARLIERNAELKHNPLVNAIELDSSSIDTRGDDSTSQSLRQLAISQGSAEAVMVDIERVIDSRPLRKNTVILGLMCITIVVACVLMPRVFMMVIPRYVVPGADLPPFTLVRFDIQTLPEAVRFGGSVAIEAKLSGPVLPDQADVVFVDGSTRRVVPMAQTDAGRFTLPIDSLTESVRFHIQTPQGRSRAYELAPEMSPHITKITASYEYPAYTRWPRTQRVLTAPDISALVGTTVTIRVGSNVDLAGGSIVLSSISEDGVVLGNSINSHTELLEVADDPKSLEGSFLVTGSLDYQISLTGKVQQESVPLQKGLIKAKTDGPPRVQLLEPDLRIMAPEGWATPLTFAANDDVGVARIDIKYRLNDQAMVVTSPKLKYRGATYASTSELLSLDGIGAGAGDTITGFATAFDHHPPPVHSADSASFLIKVISQVEYERRAREQYTLDQINEELAAFDEAEQQLNDRRDKAIEALKQLQQEMEQNEGKLTQDSQERLEALQQEIESQRRDAGKLAEAMRERAEQPGLYEFEEAIQDQLNETADRLEEQAGAGPSPIAGGDDPKQEIADALDELLKEQEAAEQAKPQAEMTAKQMQQLTAANRLMAFADWIMDITRRQRAVAERLIEYRDQSVLKFDDQTRLKQMAEEQAELADELSEALAELSSVAEEAEKVLPTMSETAYEFVDTIGELGVVNDQKDAAIAGHGMFGSIAHHYADRAAESLESLITQCRSMGGQASESIDGAFGMSAGQMGAMMNQMAQSRMGTGSKFGTGKGSGAGSSASMSSSNPSGAGSETTLAGPHFSTQNARMSATKQQRAGFGQVGGAGSVAPNEGKSQNIEPDEASLRHANPAASYNVPTRYQRLSDEYFKRLARDPISKAKGGP